MFLYSIRKATRRKWVILHAIAYAVYLFGFLLIPSHLKNTAPILSVIPVVVVGFTHGLRAGILGSMVYILLNTILLNLMGLPGWDVLLRVEGGLLGTVALIFVGCIVGLLSDLWDQLDKELTERVRLEEVEREFVQMKNELILAASHGFRVPLHTLKGFLELIRLEKVDDPRLREIFLASASVDADRLSNMVDNLLDLVQLKYDDLQLSKEEVDIRALINEALQSMGHIAEHKGVDLKTMLPERSLIAMANPVRIRQVLTNLIDNAIKFSNPGGNVVVTGDMVLDGVVSVRVSDQGIGIDRDDVHSVFDKFSGVDGNVIKQPGGSLGLSLYISRKIIEAHGGSIDVESEPGEGSTFYFSIPTR